MANGKAQTQKTNSDVLLKIQKEQKKMFGNMRQAGSSSAQADVSPNSGGNQFTPATGSFLNIGGGSMKGPFAFGLISTGGSLSITNDGAGRGHFDVGPSKAFSSNSYIFPASGFTGNLSWIDNAQWDGQILKLHIQFTYTINILTGDGSTTGNIFFPSGFTSPYAASGESIVTLMFSTTLGPNGMWIIDGISPVSTAVGANRALSNLTNPTAINQNLNFGNNSITQLNTLQFQSSLATPPFITTDGVNTFNISSHNYNISNLSNSVSSIPFIPNTGVYEVFASSHGNYGSPLAMRVASYKTVCDSTVLSANDPIGAFIFDGFSNTNVRRTWGAIICKSVSNSNLTEEGLLSFQVINNTNLTQIFTVDIGGAHFGNADFTGGIEIFAGALILDDNVFINCGTSTGSKIGNSSTQKIGFWGKTPNIRQTVTGSRGGNAALQSLLSALNTIGIINDSSTP